MIASARVVAALAVLALLIFAPQVRADENCEPVAEQMATNADQSTLSVATVCDKEGIRSYRMRAGTKDGRIDQKTVEVETEYTTMGSASLVDIDGDGYHEVEVRGMCGAGPNCEGQLYRIDRSSGKLELFFSGGYSDLSVIDGYLVEAGRASCCSWEYHAYRLHGSTGTLDYDNMDFMVEVGADLDSEEENAPARCTFSRSIEGARQVMRPPGREWLQLCELYGDYRLTTPEEASAAEAAGSAQE
ncbi:hypothetical protein [Pseudoxanthomonas sacheonensis]|uniref:Uncharacterized protein n=1 Tax=Pseudoxanthomonas sacheonensis TaxID=443615 RepID=A0ABU1RWH6_9GAMM|nr:hypothetical protein [Pseudoxanthomonas sacheonensis]MDR6842952.1 hypothetical protein [Pseudoxanthomonas sacheonensis]